MIIPNSKGKSWFWKFRHILYEMESVFLGKPSVYYFELEEILHYYYIINDTIRAHSLHKVWLENQPDKENNGYHILSEVFT